MRRAACLLALASTLLGVCGQRSDATQPARHPGALEQACVLEGRSDGALLRGKQSPNDAATIQHAFAATTDPVAKTAAAAEAQFVQLVTSGPLKLSIAQLVADDPISGYCRAVFPAAYFSGSRVVSAACSAALATLATPSPGENIEQRAAAAHTSLTVCSSRAEWLQAAQRYPVSRLSNGAASRGARANSVLTTWCTRNRDTATCTSD